MSLFGGKTGGIINVIRCDEHDYLVWKWRPEGAGTNSTNRENSIRYGSSLRVKEGEVAIFVYKQKDGNTQDFIEGPFDETIKTANFPILSSIVGLAFGGASPFQAEVYFINLSSTIQIKFAIPYFDVFDPRFLDFAVPIAVRGTMTFSVPDYKSFIKLNRLVNFDLDEFKEKIRGALTKFTKNFVSNAPSENQIPVLQLERKIMDVSNLIQERITPEIEGSFGVRIQRFDLTDFSFDKDSDGYQELRNITADQQRKTINAQTDVNIKNLQDLQSINTQNIAETMRIQREEAQRAQKLQTETNFMGAHGLDQQTDVLKTGAANLGQMGAMTGGTSGGGMNPAGMITGMMMGGAMGQQMAGVMNNMGQNMQNGTNRPPQMPNVQYFVAQNGQQTGPFNIQQLQKMTQGGQLSEQTYVWKQGMENWELAGNVQDLSILFVASAPGIVPPPMP